MGSSVICQVGATDIRNMGISQPSNHGINELADEPVIR
jgi:hypothetical protein